MSKKNILVMCRADPSKNPRPNRIINLCAGHGYVVDVVSHRTKEKLPVRKVFEVRKKSENFLLKIIRFIYRLIIWFVPGDRIKNFSNDKYYGMSGLSSRLEFEQYSLIIVEDLQILPLAFKIKRNAKILFDAREYYPLQNEESIIFNLFEKPERIRLCKAYLKDCDHIITVSNGLRDKFFEEFEVECTVVRSVPFYQELPVFINNSEIIKMVYHGRANANRNLENMIAIVERLPEEFLLDMYLVGSSKEISLINSRISDKARVSVKSPIPFNKIVKTLNTYDVGFYYLEPTGFNVKHALPNKLFEFIQARLMIAIGPSPDMRQIVDAYQCGVVSDDFTIDSMVQALVNITHKEIDKFKNNSDKVAKDLCYENESIKVANIIDDLL